MEIGDRLRDVIEKRGLVQSRVAELAGVPDETLSRIVTGVTKNPGVLTVRKIASALDLTVGWLLGEKGYEFNGDDRNDMRRFVDLFERILVATQPERKDRPPSNASAITIGPRKPPHRAPKQGKATSASASDWRESFGDRSDEREVEIPHQYAERGANLVFRADGDSMIGDLIADGDYLYVREEADPRLAQRRIVICLVDGSPYVKRLDTIGNRIRLLSSNERHPPMVFDEQTTPWNLIGVVVGSSHDIR
ncbi:MAG TPA: LexA family transcriptional regulator [Thermoanaerobaculia bacterium]|jgi:transcriptional regulator with XRE-family HTH domain|nr:LexA family transcriptional regulator [Thermoanaerobaculia bacterium]